MKVSYLNMYESNQHGMHYRPFKSYNIVIVKIVIKYLHLSICKTIQMLYHWDARQCMYTVLIRYMFKKDKFIYRSYYMKAYNGLSIVYSSQSKSG